MIAATNNQQQRTAHGRSTGEYSVRRFNRAPSPAARHKAQDTRRLARRVGLHDGSVSPLTRGFIVSSLNSPGLRSRRLSRGWCGHPDDIANFRTRTYAGLTAEQVAALLEFQSGHHVLADISDGPEHHVDPSALSHEQTDSEGFHGTVLYLSGEFPKASGDHQHEFR
jgi:hypothetical protein